MLKYLLIKKYKDGFKSEAYETVSMALHSCNDMIDLVGVFNMENGICMHVEHPEFLNYPEVSDIIHEQLSIFTHNNTQLGRILPRIGAMKKALFILLLSIAALTSRAQTVASLADSSFAIKDYIKAADYYEQALKAEPNNVKYLRRTGFCFMNFQGQELNATRYFNAALQIEPNDPVSNYYMGVIFMDQAKQSTNTSEKGNFKAKAALYLNKASQYGNNDAKSALKDLNGI